MHTGATRDLYAWEELNRGGKAQMRAGHVYAVERLMAARAEHAAGPKRRLLLATLVAVPVALALFQMIIAAAGH